MKLYLDTANDDFVLAVFDNSNNLIAKKILLGYQKKVELIPQSVHEILNELNIKINDINSFYTNLGPGYFTGVRISLVYLRTIATCLKKPIYTISTMQILQEQNTNKSEFFINARGNKLYHYKAFNDFSSSLITCETGEKEKYDEVNYDEFLDNFSTYLEYFASYNSLDEIEPYYIKLPQIGAKK
ncbi:tRNA (adenosine(37)-N6)-threonylcarbamoyltransferase complex dimerization subunit type 1 TsaB [Mycoplasmopsis felifaucium]|uniref:tRNA (Adenosine(37)-N6)-threonylcarbamoyltransferase complex dimerization subunit type 1 TsaB n=1 Tax=Mycoplasmopsis felifaucium TaxID=35768 RepID=A0ABZ2RWK2_9BACT